MGGLPDAFNASIQHLLVALKRPIFFEPLGRGPPPLSLQFHRTGTRLSIIGPDVSKPPPLNDAAGLCYYEVVMVPVDQADPHHDQSSYSRGVLRQPACSL